MYTTDNKTLMHRAFIGEEGSSLTALFVDAGVEEIRFCHTYSFGESKHWVLPASQGLAGLSSDTIAPETPVFICGKLQGIVQRHFQRGVCFSSLAVLWSAAQAQAAGTSLAIVELSASGYMLVGIDGQGELKDDLLITNSRCGAGAGINLDRVLRKLSIRRDEVDTLLCDYLGERGKEARAEIPVRADRCGVFASSATVSDKNQGIPISFALATTLKSEVVKACKYIKNHFHTVILSGGVFTWRFARDCAADYFAGGRANEIIHDQTRGVIFQGMRRLAEKLPDSSVRQVREVQLSSSREYKTLPGFIELQVDLEKKQLFRRLEPTADPAGEPEKMSGQPVLMGIDVGSTMAKVLISAAESQTPLYRASYSNAGDTIETMKTIFTELRQLDIDSLQISQIGLTGSARYQIQKALIAVYPELADRVHVLVENYAHARGSADVAGEYIDELIAQGVEGLNKDTCLLVDVGGEDTKISSIDLQRGDLYDNAMNTKCSAGTGSLLDTLVDLFGLENIEAAAHLAMAAEKAEALNATCAVFLLEHARRLQAEGRDTREILASAVWAVVENMARSLWPQIDMSGNCLVLLHGQTMQSNPLPLAVTSRLQSFLGGPAYCLVPPHPGFRACRGLVRTMAEQPVKEVVELVLAVFVEQPFTRRITRCRGTVCGEREANCYRSKLTATDAQGCNFSVSLGGCAAINEKTRPEKNIAKTVRNTCRDIWQFQEKRLPVSLAENRLIIPRSFAVSEWAQFFAALFTPLGIPVHTDTPGEEDILRGQSQFRVDTCAPHIGVAGQFLRLAEGPHGIILAPQIEFLPVTGGSLGRTCTVNQGGFAVAKGLAEARSPQCRIELFDVNLKIGELVLLAHKLYEKLLPVYRYYDCTVSFTEFQQLVEQAMAAQREFRREIADYAAKLACEALAEGRGIAVVVGREYVLNPGVYDSHVGRLLRDKGLVGIPCYVLNVDCDPRYAHLYWRNSHVIASLVDGVANRRLHRIVRHKGLKEVIRAYEQKDDLLPLVQVSTFLCGPDSITNPLVGELAKHRPFLRLQSDAAIKELAHLENRMNTYVRQLALNAHQRITRSDGDGFDVHLLDTLVNREHLDPATDVVCFPTLSDNRGLLAVIRSGGFVCLENYQGEHNLQNIVELGRSVVGDSVCAPMAAVYGDVVSAIGHFQRLRRTDPDFRDKKRLLIFNNKGLGPCRQGQYVEAHKLFLHRAGVAAGNGAEDEERLVQFLVGLENEGFQTGFPGWMFIRGVQATILQGVLHQLLAEGSARCSTVDEYRIFHDGYLSLKEESIARILRCSPPGELGMQVSTRLRNVPGIYHLAAFFGWGLYRGHLTGLLREFRRKWCQTPLDGSLTRIHIEGEAYMRTAQFEMLHQALVKILGPGRFHLTYTPVWGYLEYKLASVLMRSKEGMAESRREIKRGGTWKFLANRRRFLRNKQKRWAGVRAAHLILRQVLAAPLYRAAGIAMPEPMPKVLDVAGKIIPTRRPGGELVPYVGEAALKLAKGYDLVLNIAPEGCMVSSMGEVITPAIYTAFPGCHGKVQPLFSQQGDVDLDKLEQALLQALGPEKLHGRN